MILGPALCVNLCLSLLNCWDLGQAAQHADLPCLRQKEMKGKDLWRKYQDKAAMEREDTRFGVRSSPHSGIVSDLDQQVWVFRSQSLVAVPWNSNIAPVTVTILPCKYPESLEQGKGIPIYMGIQDPDKCLSCEEVDGQPTLQLKEEKILDLYNHTEPVKPFLFYHTQTGRTSTFESVAFPGRFIASSKNSQPIFLTSEQGEHYNINFNVDIGP